MSVFSGKTIILGVPKHFHLDQLIEAELRGLGFNVLNISFFSNEFSYKSPLQRATSFVAREICGIRDYKTKLKFAANRTWMENELEQIPVADYTLIIRPDVFPIDFIRKLRTKTKKLIAYQWDGLDCFPNVYKCIGLFDRFFVFNGSDLGVPSVLPITNYYLGFCEKYMCFDSDLQSDVFYTGTYSRHRIPDLGRLIHDFRLLGCNVRCHLNDKKKRFLKKYDLWTTNETLGYDENMRYAYNTKIIIDLVKPSHVGLSFRFFEAIRFEKKMITNNRKVAEYDFYHPNNILIWNNNDIQDLKEFIDKPYEPIPQEIKEKYSFQNWLHYALDEGQYIGLSIPK